jgi:hypothetical protein
MNNLDQMYVFQGLDQLEVNSAGFIFGQFSVLDNQIEKLSVFDILDDEVDLLLVLVNLMKMNQIRVSKDLHYLDLSI